MRLKLNLKEILCWAIKIAIYISFAYYGLPIFFSISIGIYENSLASSVTFNLDTIYINWNTSFPAVTVCEIYNGEKIWDLSEQHFGTDHDLRIDDFVGEIVYFRGTCTTCEHCEAIKCPDNFTQLLQVFRSRCSELINDCSYANRRFNCCDEFHPINTEYGTCYSFNSNQARKSSQVQYANDRSTGPGHLKFTAVADIQLHVHAPLEIPFFSSKDIRETLLLGSEKEIVLNAIEVYNDATVEPLSLENRRCRFAHERTPSGRRLDMYEFYSFSTCVVECVLEIHLDHCNCTSHFLAAGSAATVCDYRGLACLAEHYADIQEERKCCDCMGPCDEPEYNIVYSSEDDDNDRSGEVTKVKVSLVELPTQRYVRRVSKNYLDLISTYVLQFISCVFAKLLYVGAKPE